MKLLNRKKDKKPRDTHIVYGTDTGNSEYVANMAYKYYQKQGMDPAVHNISDLSPEDLRGFQNLLVVVSTVGEGAPPASARAFFRALHAGEVPELSHLRYAVCALGDSSYEYFCEAGKTIDRRLQELNARPLHSRVDCDADFAEPAIDWIKGTFSKLKNEQVLQ